MELLFILFVFALLSSILNGLTSIGGGILFFYTLFFVNTFIDSIGSSMQYLATIVMFFTLASASTGAYFYYRQKLYDRSANGYFGSGALAGGFCGSLAANVLSSDLLQIIFFLVTISASFASFFKIHKRVTRKIWSLKWLFLFGFLIGVLGGIFGIGLGFLFLPVMTLIYQVSVKHAVGSSLFCGMLLVIGALLSKIGTTQMEWDLAFVVALGGTLGTLLGGWFSVKIKSNVLQKIISISLAIIAITFLVDVLR
jgi:hypothetical protein